MKLLDKQQVKTFAEHLAFTEEQAQDIVDIFVRIYTEEQGGLPGWKITNRLDTLYDYIEEYEGHWHREENLEAHYRFEKENYDYDDKTVFDSLEKFAEYVKGTFYKLAHSDMVIVVC